MSVPRIALATSFRGALLLVVVALTFPPLVLPAETTLDGSWVMALNVASARGLIHGQDILWTFGPLSPVVYPLDVGRNLLWAIPIRLAVMGLWWIAVARLFGRTSGVVGPAALAATMVFAAQFEQFAVVLLVACLAWLAVAVHERRVWPAAVAAALSGAALLMKFNIGVSGGLATAVWAAVHVFGGRAGGEGVDGGPPTSRRRRFSEAFAVAMVGAVTSVVAWRLTGGPLVALPAWLAGSARLMQGFATQLVVSGPAADFAFGFAPLAAAALVLAAARQRRAPRDLLWAAIIALPLWAAFKASFVRHDLHALQWFLVLPACFALALPGRRGTRAQAVAVGLTVFALAVGAGWLALRWPGGSAWPRGPARIAEALRWPATRAAAQAATARAAQVSAETRFGDGFDVPGRVGEATIDSYPSDLAPILLADLNWSPRGVLQSYQAYDPALDRAAAARLEGPTAPRYLLYRHTAVDGTQPVTVDPATWRAIWRWYEIDLISGDDTFLLKHRKRARFNSARTLGTAVGRLGEPLTVPEADGKPVLLYADLSPSLAGRLMATAFRLAPPEMRIERLDGTHDRRRVVWVNLTNGILVSHMPQWLHEARPLLRKDWTPPPTTVRRVTLLADGRWWREAFAVRWAVVER